MSHYSDTGAQRTLITKHCAQRLNLPIVRREKASLVGFGQKSASNAIYDVISLTLRKPGESRAIKLEAYIVPHINSCHLTGASKIAKKLHQRGVRLADWKLITTNSDIIHTELLVGADYAFHVLSTKMLPRCYYKQWLCYNIYGDGMLIGPIPGSAPDHSSQVHNITVTIMKISLSPVLEEGESVLEVNAVDVIRELNSLDAVGINLSSRQEDDTSALHKFRESLSYTASGQASVGFPWVGGRPSQQELPSNYQMVLQRFLATMKRLN